jgi:hypothetical protein
MHRSAATRTWPWVSSTARTRARAESFAVIRAPARIDWICASSDPYVAVTCTPGPGAATCTTWLVASSVDSAPANDAVSDPSFTVPGGTDACSGSISTASVRPNASTGHCWSAPGVPRYTAC